MITGNNGTTLLDAARLALAPWATPVSTEIGNTLENYTAMKRNAKSGPRTAITHPSIQAQLAIRPTGWGTPTARDWKTGGREGQLSVQAEEMAPAGWATPAVHDTTGAKTPEQIEEMRAREPKRKSGGPPGVSNLNEQAQLADSGPTATGSPAETASSGRLNPGHSRWLMGLPKDWDDCAPEPAKRSRKK